LPGWRVGDNPMEAGDLSRTIPFFFYVSPHKTALRFNEASKMMSARLVALKAVIAIRSAYKRIFAVSSLKLCKKATRLHGVFNLLKFLYF